MDPTDLMCDLWKPLRMLLQSGVQFAMSTARVVAKGTITILEEALDALEGTFGGSGGSSSLLLILLAAGAIWVLASDDDKKRGQRGQDAYSVNTNATATQSSGGNHVE